MSALEQLLKIISPTRPQELRVTSGLGALAQALRGGTQPAGQLLKQLQGKPGVKSGALSQVFGHVDPATRLTPQELGSQARSPRLFAQRGIGAETDMNLANEMANDLIYGPEFATERAKLMIDTMAEAYGNLAGPQQQLFNKARRLSPEQWSPEFATAVEEVAERAAESITGWGMHDIYMEALGDRVLAMAMPDAQAFRSFEPAWESYQRQAPSIGMKDFGGGYFETVLRTTPKRGSLDTWNLPMTRGTAWDASELGNMHFVNPAQLGHIRGAASPDTRMMVLDEIQSDPLELLGAKHPAMQGIYGQLGRMAVERAAAADLDKVLIPDAKRIASVRDQRQLPFFQSVYDKALGKELYEPLAARGIPVSYDNGWYSLSLDDAIREAVKKNSGILNYKRGGLAQAART